MHLSILLLALVMYSSEKQHIFFRYQRFRMAKSRQWVSFTILVLINSILFFFAIQTLAISTSSVESVPIEIAVFIYIFIAGFLTTYYLNPYTTETFSFVSPLLSRKTRNIHLNSYTSATIKSIAKVDRKAAKTKLQQAVSDSLSKCIYECFEKTKCQRQVMLSHHIGRLEDRQQLIESLSNDGYDVMESPLTRTTIWYVRFILCFVLTSLKPLGWEIGKVVISQRTGT